MIGATDEMKVYENQEFHSFDDRDSGAVFADVEFRSCYFEGCGLSVTSRPALRSTVRNVRLVNCSQRGSSLHAAIFEDVVVDGFKTNGQLFQTWGAAFKHVVLRGKIDRLMISSLVTPAVETTDEQRAFDEANAAYYRNVDWALDISAAEFKELDIRGLSARLIRRDPETQVVVTRADALQGDWRKLEFREAVTPLSLQWLLEWNLDDMVLIAPKRHPKFSRYLEDINLLRKAGITVPD